MLILTITEKNMIGKIMGIRQLAIFALLVFAFYGFFQDVNTSPRSIIFYVLYVFLGVSIVKFGVFYLLKTYRTVLGGNHRNVVILGWNNQAEELKNFFLENKAYGYTVKSTFDINNPKVSLDNIFRYVLNLSIFIYGFIKKS